MSSSQKKSRTLSEVSSTSSATEYVNEGFQSDPDNKPKQVRTTSEVSSTSSATEFINEGFQQSEPIEHRGSIEKTDDATFATNPLSNLHLTRSSTGPEVLHNVVDFGDGDGPSSTTGIRKMYVAALVVLMFAVNMGIAATYSATATQDMQKSNGTVKPTDEEVSWIGSLIAVGALVGGSVGGLLSNIFGRKGALILNTLPFVIGWIMVAFANSVALVYAGRIVTGFSGGLISVATPMYLVEISTPEVRGLLGASFQLFVVVGVLIIAVLGSFMSWRNMAIAGGVGSLLAAVLMIPIPESPRWLMTKKKREQAMKALVFLQGESYDAKSELDQMEEEILSQPEGGIGLDELKAPTIYKPFVLSILLMFFQQFSGVNAVMFYTVKIFESAHSSLDAVVATIVVAAVQVGATLVSSLLMDRAGRKILLLLSASVMALSLTVFGGFDLAATKNPAIIDSFGWLPVVCLMVFVAAFAIGYGPAPWLMVAEMTPPRARGLVSGVSTGLNWTFAFIVTKTFEAETRLLHSYGVYWLYVSFCVLSLVFVHFSLPETKGKSEEEIYKYFENTIEEEEEEHKI